MSDEIVVLKKEPKVVHVTYGRTIKISTPGPPGPSGAASASYVHVQNTPSSIWNITHLLGFRPNITVKDTGGNTFEGDVTYNSLNELTIDFGPASFAGEAYLS